MVREEYIEEMDMKMLHMEKKVRTGQPAQAMRPKKRRAGTGDERFA